MRLFNYQIHKSSRTNSSYFDISLDFHPDKRSGIANLKYSIISLSYLIFMFSFILSSKFYCYSKTWLSLSPMFSFYFVIFCISPLRDSFCAFSLSIALSYFNLRLFICFKSSSKVFFYSASFLISCRDFYSCLFIVAISSRLSTSSSWAFFDS